MEAGGFYHQLTINLIAPDGENQMTNQQSQELASNKENGSSSEYSANEVPQSDKNYSATTLDKPDFGWSAYAERVNGRFAMIGFIAILLIETISKAGFLNWAGLIS